MAGSIAINFFVFGLVSAELFGKSSTAEAAEASSHIVRKLNKFTGVFAFLWSWGCLNRLAGGVGYDPYWTAVMHALCVPLQGFCNALLYFDAWDMFAAFLQTGAEHLLLEHPQGGVGSSQNLREAVLELMPEPRFLDVELFVCTFNMGEGSAPSDISKLLPRDADLYVIGLQECMCLEQMRNVMQTFVSEAEEYERYDAEIGATNKSLGYHGYIALTILVKKRYVHDGSFVVSKNAVSQVKQGVNLMVTRASNKGGVGLPCRFFDQSLAFVTCHLASDQHGKTRLHKRIEDARQLISNKTGLVLSDDDVGFDFPITNHHTFVLGGTRTTFCSCVSPVAAFVSLLPECAHCEIREAESSVCT